MKAAKRMKKLVTTISLLTAAALFTGCGGAGSAGTTTGAGQDAASTTAAADSKSAADIKIGVLQLVQHDALGAANKGFVDGLAEAGYKDGENITIDQQNAQGDQSNCSTIAQKFVDEKKDLILAIGTPAAQAVASKTESIPTLITAVTDPADSGLVESNKKPGLNITGTSDLTPCKEQIDLLKEILPDVKTVGMLYCSSESNSKFQVKIAEKACKDLGIKYIEKTVSNSNEIKQVTESMIGKVDAIYAPTDNMIAAGMANVASVANANKIPIICGEGGMVDKGGLATIGIDYYELGKQTAAMAVKILKGEEKPENMPIEYLEKTNLKINEDAAKECGITIPKSVLDRVTK